MKNNQETSKGCSATQPLENPYHRFFTKMPTLEDLARRAYEQTKSEQPPADAKEQK